MNKINELKEKREDIFKKINDLNSIIHILEATANHYYCPNDKMWNVLLKARDDIEDKIEKEIMLLYKEAEKLDKEIKKVMQR